MKKRITMLLVLMVSSLLAWSNSNDSVNTAAAAKNAKAVKEYNAKLKLKLEGEWGNNSISVVSKTSERVNMGLSYFFRSNGQYSKVLHGQKVNIKETGTWELSNDGKFLMLTAASCTQPERIEIKLLDTDKMVLAQRLNYESVGINIKSNNFFFIKR